MRKINKLVAIAILAAIATFSAPQASAGIMLSDNSLQASGGSTTSLTGVVMGDFTGIILTDLAYAITGVVMGD
jgi:hypothetical protein